MNYHLENGKAPAYVGVYNALYSDITGGVYPENEVLPGEMVLAETYGVSRNTLRQALAILAEDGLILRSQGKSTMVAPRRETAPEDKMKNPMASLARQAITGVKIQYNYGPPTDIARAKLGLTASEIVLAGDATYRVGKEVVGYSFTQVPVSAFEAMGIDLSKEAAVEWLITQRIFEHAEAWNLAVKLIYANEMEAAFLETEEGAALLLFEALLQDGAHRPFARCKFYFLPRHYQLELRV